MGQCCSKTDTGESHYELNYTQECQENNVLSPNRSSQSRTVIYEVTFSTTALSTHLDSLLGEMLSVIGSLVHNDQEPPEPLVKIHELADNEGGWLEVICAMVRNIPMDDPLGPHVITLLLDDCPLPTRQCVSRISPTLGLSGERANNMQKDIMIERNICIILGCIAEKLAGPNSIAILTPNCLDYLFTYLSSEHNPNIVLFALIALEKFAQTSENKNMIKKRLKDEVEHPLLKLEAWVGCQDFAWRQVGFCAQWCLDNLFLVDGRNFSYQEVDQSDVNVILNSQDVSQYLKIAPNGLEARCDSHSFESVRCTFQVNQGCWYYETLIITPGVMQIGWATKNSNFLNHDGYGIGDDSFSLAYDGCRRLIWFNAQPEIQNSEAWQPGDILGCLLDLDRLEIIFSVNGRRLEPCYSVFKSAKTGFFAAASFMSFQQCKFNFGAEPFAYPPGDRLYFCFNDHATLPGSERVIIPRHLYQDQLRDITVGEDSCTLCFDNKATIIFEPCHHKGFCTICSAQLMECPMCRAKIDYAREDDEDKSDD